MVSPEVSEVSIKSLQDKFEGKFFKSLFEQIHDGIIVTDKEGIVVFWSASAEELYGFKAKEMIGHHIDKLGPGFDLDKFKQRLIDGKASETGEWSKELPNGATQTFRVTTTSLSNSKGEFVGVFGLSHDVTKEKELQAEIEEAVVTAQETSRLKSAFLSSLSHEIKTPLAGIIGLSDLILSSTNDKDLQHYAQVQKDSCQRLLNTMSSILEMSKMEASESHFRPKICNLNEIVGELIKPYKILGEKKGLNFSYTRTSSKLLTLVDPTILTQIISNIISNAIKYTPTGSVHVRLSTNEDDSQTGVLTIKDTGIGMNENFALRLFEPYSREDREEVLQSEGDGLGLNIAHQYIKMLGWHIEVDTNLNEGSEFKIVFPLFDTKEVTTLAN